MKVQLKNEKSLFMNWKYNQKMKIKVHLSIGKKVQLENGRNMHLQKSNYKMEIVPNVKQK